MSTGTETLFDARRERLRRAVEDGERLYRKRMHGEPTIADDNRINGILTMDLEDALGLADWLVSVMHEAIENLEGDLYLHAIDGITSDTFFTAVRDTKDRLKEAVGEPSGSRSMSDGGHRTELP